MDLVTLLFLSMFLCVFMYTREEMLADVSIYNTRAHHVRTLMCICCVDER